MYSAPTLIICLLLGFFSVSFVPSFSGFSFFFSGDSSSSAVNYVYLVIVIEVIFIRESKM